MAKLSKPYYTKSVIYRTALILLICIISCTLKANTPKDNKKEYLITISTEFGKMYIILFNETPIHKNNFIKLSKEGFYDGTTFHRVIKDFMVQGGDPNSKDTIQGNEGRGGPGYTLPNEIHPKLKHKKGAVAAARLDDRINPNRESSGSQFYIVQNAQGAPHLDNAYTVFGQVIGGMEILDKIAQQPTRFDKPLKDITMTITVSLMKKKKISNKFGYNFI